MPPPPPPQFDPIPATFSRNRLRPDENHDRDAIGQVGQLASHYRRHAQRRYRGWGAWGYTVLRTVYTPESDVLFPVAMERLRALVRYWCHYTRFPAFGASCEKRKVVDEEWNEEVAGRFWLDVVEDREGLGGFGGVGSGVGGGEGEGGVDEPTRFGALAEYFRRWCEGVDTQSDTGDARNVDPRFTGCLVVDTESLAALAQIPEELPPLRCAATREEKADIQGTGYPAWLWIVEARYMALPAERRAEGWGGAGDAYPGWLRVEPRDLFPTWSDHWYLNDGDRALCLGHAEVSEGSGVYVYSPAWVTRLRDQGCRFRGGGGVTVWGAVCSAVRRVHGHPFGRAAM